MYVYTMRPVPIDPTPLTSAAARLSAFTTSCPAHRGEADVQSGLPADAASLRETGSADRYTAWARGPSNSIAACGAVSCLINVADGAEGLHFSAI